MKRLLYLLAFSFWLAACTKENTHDHSHDPSANASETFTCPMHPQIVRNEPGTCPICGMELVRRDASAASAEDMVNALMLTDNQIMLGNITTAKVAMMPVGNQSVINGTLVENKNLTEIVSSRAAGRVERLFIKETGLPVKKGQPIYQLYSENLLTLQQEYKLAKEQYTALGATEKRYKSFLDAAEKKLLLYGLTQNQIDNLAKTDRLSPTVTFLSPTSGIISEININEGEYVSEGTGLMKIEDITRLWLEAELYPGERNVVQTGDKISVRISGYEDTPVAGVVDFISPELNPNSQITLVRAVIDNPRLLFQPGMQAQVFLAEPTRQSLAIPSNAVVRDGNGAHVYIQRGRNTFQPQMVSTGLEDFTQIEITAGLQEGDTIAVTGAYLLYSELILKKGRDPMAGHQH